MLIKAAKDRKFIFYSEVGEQANLSMKNPHHRTQLGDILCQINTAEHDSGRPLLSVLVVHKKDKKPGQRFFDLARELGKQKPDEDNDTFYADELKRVFDKWGSSKKPEAGFDTLDHAVTERNQRQLNTDDTIDKAKTIFGDQLYNGKLLAGQYRIIGDEPLGSGGMGEVWKATDTELGTNIAIKILPPMMARDKAAIENLKREAMIGQQLTHQNICRLYGFHSESKLKFIVMEYVDGQTLKEVLALRDDRKFTWDELEPIARPVAEALDYAHNATYKDVKGRSVKGVLHRDIKPANIMITKDGQAKLMDFGIAREIHNTMTQLTGRSSSLTPMYASPEQYRGEPMTSASDIYSFTAVLYECLASKSYISPHGDLAYQILHKEFESLASQNEAINKALETGLAKEAAKRSKTAGQLIKSLKTRAKPKVESPKKTVVEQEPIESKTSSQPKAGDVITNLIGMKLVYIPAGNFLMGSPSSEYDRNSNEGPQHNVLISKGFWMGICEVTQTQYKAVMGKYPSEFSGVGNPVERINWMDAMRFCKKLGRKEGKRYILPTEAQWEYACRAGTETPSYFSDDRRSSLDDYVWHSGNSGKSTHPVGQKRPNDFGLYDMNGNVREWCRDGYGENYYSKSPGTDPYNKSWSKKHRVLRGGSWRGSSRDCRSACRHMNLSSDRLNFVGFRVVMEARGV